jgi:hypothetical protein
MGVHGETGRQAAPNRPWLGARCAAQGRAGVGRRLPPSRAERSRSANRSGRGLGRNDVRHRGARADRQHGAKLAQRQTPGPMVDDAARREMPDKSGNRKKTRYDYCAAIRNKPVSKLTTEDALRVLKPMWQTRPETANRLRAAASGSGTSLRRAPTVPVRTRSAGAGISTQCHRQGLD